MEIREILYKNEDWLMKRILDYALKYNFTKYTSTLEEAWRISIVGLNKSIVTTYESLGDNIELDPDDKFEEDPLTEFGIIEARKHRERGIPLTMFLGLYKYYKQTYHDLLQEKYPKFIDKYSNFIERSFDRIEISYVNRWAGIEENDYLLQLQQSNRKMTNEKNSYLTVFESIGDPVILVDPNLKVMNLNHAAAKIIKTTFRPGSLYYSDENQKEKSKNIIGQNLSEAFPFINSCIKDLYDSENSSLDGECHFSRNNAEKYYLYSINPMLDVSKKYAGSVIILKDITLIKRLEERLLLVNEELERKVKERTAELKNAYKKLEEAWRKEQHFNDLQKGFIKNISHEYKTPLQSILISTDILEACYLNKNTTEFQNSIQRIKNSTKTLNKIVDDALLIDKRNNGEIELEKSSFSISELIKKVIMNTKILDKNNHIFKLDDNFPDQLIESDGKIYEYVISELLLNASKYSDQNTTINIGLSKEFENIKIVIKDKGKGFSEDELSKLYTPFFKRDEDIAIKKGSGMGLAIVKYFIDELGGDLEVESKSNVGTTITISLPLVLKLKKAVV